MKTLWFLLITSALVLSSPLIGGCDESESKQQFHDPVGKFNELRLELLAHDVIIQEALAKSEGSGDQTVIIVDDISEYYSHVIASELAALGQLQEDIAEYEFFTNVQLSEGEASEFWVLHGKFNGDLLTWQKAARMAGQACENWRQKLIYYAKAGDLDKVKEFIEAGWDVNYGQRKISHGKRTLEEALTANRYADYEHLGVVPALQSAIRAEFPRVVEYLIDNGAIIQPCTTFTEVVSQANLYSYRGDVSEWFAVLDRVREKDPKGPHACADDVELLVKANNSAELMQYLQEAGFDLLATDEAGVSLIARVLLSTRASIDVVKFLHECGADIDAVDGLSRTVLHLATKDGNNAVARYALESGCNAEALDVGGRNVLHYAAGVGNEEVLNLGIAAGLDVNQLDRDGKTPSHYAKTAAIREILAKAGAHQDLRNRGTGEGTCHLAFDSKVLELLDFTHKPDGYAWQLYYRMGDYYRSPDYFLNMAGYDVPGGRGELERRDLIARETYKLSLHDLFRLVCDYNRDIYLDAVEIHELMKTAGKQLLRVLERGPSGEPLPPPKLCSTIDTPNGSGWLMEYDPVQATQQPCELAFDPAVIDLLWFATRNDGWAWHLDLVEPAYSDSCKFYKAAEGGLYGMGGRNELDRRRFVARAKYGLTLHELFMLICEYNRDVFLNVDERRKLLMSTSDQRLRSALQHAPGKTSLPPARECAYTQSPDEGDQNYAVHCHLAFDPEVLDLLDFAHRSEGLSWQIRRLGPGYYASAEFYGWAASYLRGRQTEAARRDRVALGRYGLTLHELFKLTCDYNREIYLDDEEIAERLKTVRRADERQALNLGPFGQPLPPPKECTDN